MKTEYTTADLTKNEKRRRSALRDAAGELGSLGDGPDAAAKAVARALYLPGDEVWPKDTTARLAAMTADDWLSFIGDNGGWEYGAVALAAVNVARALLADPPTPDWQNIQIAADTIDAMTS